MTVYGPYIGQGDRRYVVLYTPDKTRSMSYARWLVQEQLGRELTEDETVDHIDEDCTNDALSNLQILSSLANITKSTTKKRKPLLTLVCAGCRETFQRAARRERARQQKQKAGPFCSVRCAGCYGKKIQSEGATCGG
jgi:hypothetical protein